MSPNKFNKIIVLLFLIASCKKTDPGIIPLASINIVNATVNLGTIKANFTNAGTKNNGYQYYSQITTSIGYGSNSILGVLAQTQVPITIAPISDTAQPIYSGSLNFAKGAGYSLYLAGTAAAVDTILMLDAIPYYSDSSCGVRFINLSYNSNSIIITQAVTPTVDDFSSMSYKQISAFKTYNAGQANASYSFQVRDAATNTLLATYVLSTPYFHNVTLAWIGQTGGSGANAPKIVRINNY
jgi:hypothetical protein